MGEVNPIVWILVGALCSGSIVAMGMGIHRILTGLGGDKAFAHRSAEQEQYMTDVRIMNLRALERVARGGHMRPKVHAGPA